MFDRGDFREGATDAFVNAASQIEGLEKSKPRYDVAKADRIRLYANMLYEQTTSMFSESPNFALYLTRLGWVLQRLGESDHSTKVVKRAMSILPNNEQVRQQANGSDQVEVISDERNGAEPGGQRSRRRVEEPAQRNSEPPLPG